VAKWGTVASINQTGTGIRLPNFCNLGVMLRAVVVVNIFLLAAAVLRAGSPGAFASEFLSLAGFSEPALILSLLALCATRRLLHAMGYAASWIAVLTFELHGGREAGQRFVEALELHSHVANIGDVRSLAIHPATTTHSQLTEVEQVATGVDPGLVRLSVGLETIDDILADLDKGFAAAAAG